MSFFSKKFSKGTIIESENCIHINTNTKKGLHKGVVDKQVKDETFFHIFTHDIKGNNKPVDFSKFNGGDYRPDNLTNITDAIFKDKSKKIKRVGGKYYV